MTLSKFTVGPARVCSFFETWDRICKLYGWPQTFA
jgi:hypothetical protein